MKLISEKRGIQRLKEIVDEFRGEIRESYEPRAKSCLTCTTKGACCLDAHFVNVHISRLEASAMNRSIEQLPTSERDEVRERIDAAIVQYRLDSADESFDRTFACPLFEPARGCIVHNDIKPAACVMHACYESAEDLPPNDLLSAQELKIDGLNERVYGNSEPWLPLPVALRRNVT